MKGDATKGGAMKDPLVGQKLGGTHPSGSNSCFENSSATMPYLGAVQTALRFIAFHFKYAKLDTLKMEIPVLCALETPLKHQWETLQPVKQHVME